MLTGAWCESRLDRHGSLTLLLFSRAEPSRESIGSSSFEEDLRFLPQSLHATTASPPSNIAPPIPPTTPPITSFCVLLRPVLPDDPLLPFKPGAFVEDAAADSTATTLLVVLTFRMVLPWSTEIIVVKTCCVVLPVFFSESVSVDME